MKLFKTEDGYALSQNNDFDDLNAITNHELAEDHGLEKLSLKNCDLIANGYDLDELIESSKHDLVHANKSESLYYSRGIYYAFQKALEILGDKKYSDEDIRQAYMDGAVNIDCEGNPVYDIEEDLQDTIQSLQQTEWDVEIVTKPYTEVHPGFVLKEKREYKLDSDGCLILKRI